MLKVDIDKFVRSALNRNKPAYDEGVWQGIEARLDAAQKPKPGISGVWLYISAFLAISMAGGTGYFLGLKHSDKRIAAAAIISPNTPNIYSNSKNTSLKPANSGRLLAANSSESEELSSANSNAVITLRSSSQPIQGHSIALNGVATHKTRQPLHEPTVRKKSKSPAQDVIMVSAIAPLERKDIPVFYASMETILPAEIQLNETHAPKQHDIDPALTGPVKPCRSHELRGIIYNLWDNPAYAGAEAKYNFNSKADMRAFDKKYKPATNYYSSLDVRIEKLHSGFGVYAIRSVIPTLGTNTFGSAYSYKISLPGAGLLSFGLGGTVSNNRNYIVDHYDRGVENNGFILTPGGDPLAISTWIISSNAGVAYEGTHLLAGATINSFNRPANPEGAPVSMQYIYTAGYKANIGYNIHLLSVAEVRSGMNNAWSEKASILANYKSILTGLSWQNMVPGTYRGDLSIYLGADIRSRLRIFSSYGYGTSHIEPASGYRILQAGLGYRFK
jgi:hypothetical protein